MDGCRLMIGIYKFYKDWSTETFRDNQRCGVVVMPAKSGDRSVFKARISAKKDDKAEVKATRSLSKQLLGRQTTHRPVYQKRREQ